MNNAEMEFLEKQMTGKTVVTVYLLSGVKLSGLITAVCPRGLVLTREGKSQFIYQHATSTVMEGTPRIGATTY